jgi:hypothetical protein
VPSEERRALEDALASVRDRFGSDAVGSAAFIDRGRLRTGRRQSYWGPEDDPNQTGQNQTGQNQTGQNQTGQNQTDQRGE